jgi:hypothetical protein
MVPSVPIAASGMPAPGRTTAFGTIDYAYALRGGYVGLAANTQDPAPGNHGVWLDRGGGLEPVAFDGDPVPGAPGSIYAPSNLTANRRGDVLFSAMGLSGFSLVTWRSGTLAAAVLGNSPAPGTSDVFSILGRPVMSNDGCIAFESSLASSTDTGIWSNAFGRGLELLALTGQPAPGGGVYQDVANTTRMADGVVVHRSPVLVGTSTLQAIVEHTAAGARLVARNGDPASGIPGQTYNIVAEPFMNERGHILFRSTLKGSADPHDGLFLDLGAGPQPLALDGQATPDLPGNTFATFDTAVLSDTGRVALKARVKISLPDLRRDGIWSDGLDGTLRLVAFTGQTAPDVPGGVMFEKFRDMAINESGQVAFVADLTSAASPRPRGLFVQDPSGVLDLVAYEGQSFEVLPGSTAVISDLQFNDALWNPLPQSFSGSRLVYRLVFDDGRSGLYAAAVPDPATLALVALGGLGVLLRRRRK